MKTACRSLIAVMALCATTLAGADTVGAARAEDIRRAEAEIARLPVAYAWAVDAKDIDGMMAIFAEDAVYDLSAYGQQSAVGHEALRQFFTQWVFRAEQCSFSSISNVRVKIDGTTATGADYFMHFGYHDPNYGGENGRHYVEGQHFYEFVLEDGHWKIARMLGRPTFERVEQIAPGDLKHCP